MSFDERAVQVGLGLSHHRREDEGLLPSSRMGWATGAAVHQALRPDLGRALPDMADTYGNITMSTTKTTVYLDSADYRRLKAVAERRGTSAAQLVREAVSEYVKKTEGDHPMPRSVGAGRSGRGDLSERAEELLGEELLRGREQGRRVSAVRTRGERSDRSDRDDRGDQGDRSDRDDRREPPRREPPG